MLRYVTIMTAHTLSIDQKKDNPTERWPRIPNMERVTVFLKPPCRDYFPRDALEKKHNLIW
ncbi:hypothetical protein E2C01_017195 [Portunus trituberculatus]|uniref:Uncharacterized protein n=1 Tax=Portunus trituberculatus TaxID=210409 RepID=A0A5B7DSY4_PORTR|nr:hypothetical protein [Portunus trituberculatus]